LRRGLEELNAALSREMKRDLAAGPASHCAPLQHPGLDGRGRKAATPVYPGIERG